MSARLDSDFAAGDARRSGSGGGTELARFVEAKRRIGESFQQLHDYITGVNDTLTDLRMSRESLVPTEAMKEVAQLGSSVNTIREILARNHMKVVFFGRTSNGKSTTVNAMLHSKILPQGMGHTTRCFLQVEASPDGRSYVLAEGSDEERAVDSIEALGSALHNQALGEDALVKIFWPSGDSKLLANEVVLVDSPGVDLSPEFDAWIDKHCLDADVFVLVSNAESTLTQAEKNFFHRVSAKLSRPNLFILNNRWDASANEPESMEKVRSQHMARFSSFLTEELGVCTEAEVRDRVFFVSAKEVLHQRLKDKGAATPTSFLADGWQNRSLEFSAFEEHFERLISKAAIQTKFETHLGRAQEVAQRLHDLLQSLQDSSNKERESQWLSHEEKLAELRESQRKLLHFIAQSKEQIQRLSAEVQLRVSEDFRDAIRRLDGYVESYKRPWADGDAAVAEYKKGLIAYLDDAVSQDLNIRFTGGLRDSIERTERAMLENIRLLLPESAGHKATAMLTYREPFRFALTLDCHDLAEDFQEDLEFRFSLGLTSLLRRLLQLKRAAAGGAETRGGAGADAPYKAYLPRAFSSADSAASTSSSIVAAQRRQNEDEEALLRSVLMTTATYAANGGVGLLLIGGLVYRSLGWRVIALGAAGYTGIYLWERARWNSGAQEAALKDQLRRHLAARLRQLSHIVTANCDAQVTREVGEVLTRLQSVASETHQELKRSIEKLREDVDALDVVAKRLQKEGGSASELSTELSTLATALKRELSPKLQPKRR